MQRIHESEGRSGHTPPPPYTLVDQLTGNNNQIPQQQQYHSQNPYPATVIPPEADLRLAQKLQDEEYAQWIDTNQQQQDPARHHHCTGETSAGCHNNNNNNNPSAPPLPSIPENYQYNHYPSYQNDLGHCHHPHLPPQHQYQHHHHNQSVVYASPNQPPLPYTQTAHYPNNNNNNNGGVGSCEGGNHTYYGSLSQGYYPTQSHPFYNAQVPHQHVPYRSIEEEDNSSNCLTGFALASLLCYCCSLIED